jgi:hypothetical protein
MRRYDVCVPSNHFASFYIPVYNCGVNLAGIKMILDLMNQVERLQSEVRFLRQ